MSQHSQQHCSVNTGLNGNSSQVKGLVRRQRILSLRLMLPSLKDLLGKAEANERQKESGENGG